MQQTKVHKIKKGLDIRIVGEAKKVLDPFHSKHYGIAPSDFKWITPQMLIKEQDTVSIGTPLFSSKDDERIKIVSPVSGSVSCVIRGEKRKIEHIVLESDGRNKSVDISINGVTSEEEIKSLLLQYGLWAFIKQRPFGGIAKPDDKPKAIFISCFDTAPLAPDTNFIIQDEGQEFLKGVEIISQLTEGETYLCIRAGDDDTIYKKAVGVQLEYFKGSHPAGNVGTQINRISPIDKGEVVWYIAPQDVVIIGRLFLRGRLDFSRTVAICGSGIENPCYIKAIAGSSIFNDDKEISLHGDREYRVISGNVLTGKQVGEECFLGYYDNIICAIPEGKRRYLFGWLYPGFKTWSISRTYVSWWFPHKRYDMDTLLHGGHRTMIMSDIYDRVFPLDILPMELLKACVIGDIERMEQLGIYEVEEEDFALCEVVCPSKTDCQQIIHEGLKLIRQ